MTLFCFYYLAWSFYMLYDFIAIVLPSILAPFCFWLKFLKMYLISFIPLVLYGRLLSKMRLSAMSPEVQRPTKSNGQKLRVWT
jgi:hypothetical protein